MRDYDLYLTHKEQKLAFYLSADENVCVVKGLYVLAV